jgi:fanconi anemia group M protein
VPDPVRIVADLAERRSAVYRALAALPPEEVDLAAARLPVADYLLGPDLAVERKTAADFAASIADRRLFAQVAALKAAYARPVILIEGGFAGLRTRMHPNALRGALSYLVAIEGLAVLRTDDAEETAPLLVQLARHAQHGLTRLPETVAKPTAADLAARQQRLVAALPDVGPTLARALLLRFGSPRAVFAATEADLRSVPGIGPTRAAAIARALDAAFAPDPVAPSGPGWLVAPTPADAARRGPPRAPNDDPAPDPPAPDPRPES